MTTQTPLTPYQQELARLLKLSTLTPGTYNPSAGWLTRARGEVHATVFADSTPLILCGLYDDPKSVAEAQALASSRTVLRLRRARGFAGAISAGSIDGASVPWRFGFAAVGAKTSGQVEGGTGTGPLVALVLDDKGAAQGVATALCVTTETARIFNAAAPELDDGVRLPALACREVAAWA